MSFRVVPDDLDGYARQLGRARDDAETAQRYLKEHGEMSSGEQGWLALLGDTHKSIVAAVDRELAALDTLTAGASRELANAAGYYRKTDEKSASRSDDAYRPMFTRADYVKQKHQDERSGGI
jgi:hypothetical protein